MLTMGRVGMPVRELLESHKNTYSDLRTAQRATAEEVVEWLRKGEIQPEDISLRESYDALVAENNPHLDLRYSDFPEVQEAIVSSSFPIITKQLIHSVFMREYEYPTADLRSLFQEVESANSEETYAGVTPGERGGFTEEGAPYSEIQIGEKKVQIANKKFGKGVSLTREMVLFDRTGRLVTYAKRNAEYLGNLFATFMCYRLTDTAWTEIDIAGTSQAFIINGTRRAMFADDHSSWDGYANDNVTAAGLPSISVVKAMNKLGRAMRDEQGEKITTSFPVVYGSDMMKDDLEQFFVHQDTDINSAERNKNIYKGSSRIVTSPFFPSETEWYRGNPARQFILQWVWRPRTVSDLRGDPQRDIVGSWWSSFMCGIGAEDYRFVIKNPYAG